MRPEQPVWAGPYVYKVLAELHEPTRLTADRTMALGQALADHGFRGDFKVPVGPGRARFQYNHIIVHAPTPEDAACAEAVIVDLLGQDVARVGRGADADVPTLGRLSWHDWLLALQGAPLPADVDRFVGAAGPVPAPHAGCER